MNLSKTPPVPMTDKCVDCGRNMEESTSVKTCGYCLRSVCDRCADTHDERKGHADVPGGE